MYGIAKNTVNSHIRRAKAREQRVDRAETELVRDLHSSFSFDPEEHLTLRRCADSIQGRFAGLADWQVEIFVLRHIDDLPIGEIAARTSRSNDAVRSSLCRVKRVLVEAVETGPLPEERPSVERSST